MDFLFEGHKKFLLLLLKCKVEFMLIGGYAVIYYGYERGTADMDIWLKPTNENRDKFILALKELGISNEHLNAVSKMDFTNAQVLSLGEKPNKIDILTKIQGVIFEEADKEKQLYPLKNQFIPIIQYRHLIITKMITGRPQDKAGVDVLQKINRKRNSE